MLNSGVHALKYHYTNLGKSRPCRLYLSPDFSRVLWTYNDEPLEGQLLSRDLKLELVEAILYGAESFTFQSFHLSQILSIASAQTPLEFYSWECLTFKMPNRTVDFVIGNG